jgi:5-methyltetrahydropteroyltriglutamate--homocysteine methyltransferase
MNKRDDATRAETVGSLLRGGAVVRAARRSGPADAALLGDAVRDAIRMQEEIGLDVITDGEVRRVAWAQTTRFLDCFAPTAGRGALNWRGATGGPSGAPDTGSAPAGYPAVVRRVATAARVGDMTDEYAFLARYARARTKYTMPAPSYHRRYWSEELSRQAYDSCEEYLTEIRDYLRSVVDRLVSLGCDYIQLDAPNYGSLCDPDTRAAMTAEGRDPDAELAFDAGLDNSLFDGVHGVTTALHVCRGNGPGGAWHSAGGYGAISKTLFPKLAVSRLLLEYDSDRAGTFEPLTDVRDGTVVVLGLITTKSDDLDDEAAVAARIAEATRYKPLSELALSTQCGFASVPVANPVTPAGQRAKLEMVVRLARRMLRTLRVGDAVERGERLRVAERHAAGDPEAVRDGYQAGFAAGGVCLDLQHVGGGPRRGREERPQAVLVRGLVHRAGEVDHAADDRVGRGRGVEPGQPRLPGVYEREGVPFRADGRVRDAGQRRVVDGNRAERLDLPGWQDLQPARGAVERVNLHEQLMSRPGRLGQQGGHVRGAAGVH